MSELTYTVRGRQMSEAEFRNTAVQAPKAAPAMPLKRVEYRENASEHGGFVVLGYPPGTEEAVPELHAAAMKRHGKDATAHRHPGTPEEFLLRWFKKNKAKRIRSKPYSIPVAADDCAEMARKAGWQRVRVEEILKG